MKPLEGLRVLDLTRVMAGQFGTALLADPGAEVIKLGPRRASGQPARHPMATGRHGHRAARLLALEAARQRQAGQRLTQAASMAKRFASEMVGRMTDAALQIHGGYGFTRDFPLERLVRTSRIMRIYEGSSEIQCNIIASHLPMRTT